MGPKSFIPPPLSNDPARRYLSLVRIQPDLTLDRSLFRRKSSGDRMDWTNPYFPVYFFDAWKNVNFHRPWHHLRYHSSVSVGFVPDYPMEGSDGEQAYQTLHLLTVDQRDDLDYFLPHEGPSSRFGFPKIFAACVELGPRKMHPPIHREVHEVSTAKKKITKRRSAVSFTRLDFLTSSPLGLRVDPEAEIFEFTPLSTLQFKPLVVLETEYEKASKRWEKWKATHADNESAGA